MASPGCRRWQHKGRTSKNPALNRYGRSRSALYRADMAMGNPAQWSFRALRVQRPLRVTSGRKAALISMSAFGGKADVIQGVAECPLIATSGHWWANKNDGSGEPDRTPHLHDQERPRERDWYSIPHCPDEPNTDCRNGEAHRGIEIRDTRTPVRRRRKPLRRPRRRRGPRIREERLGSLPPRGSRCRWPVRGDPVIRRERISR